MLAAVDCIGHQTATPGTPHGRSHPVEPSTPRRRSPPSAAPPPNPQPATPHWSHPHSPPTSPSASPACCSAPSDPGRAPLLPGKITGLRIGRVSSVGGKAADDFCIIRTGPCRHPRPDGRNGCSPSTIDDTTPRRTRISGDVLLRPPLPCDRCRPSHPTSTHQSARSPAASSTSSAVDIFNPIPPRIAPAEPASGSGRSGTTP